MTLDLAIPDLAAAHGSFAGALLAESEQAVRQFAASTLPDLVKAVGPETEGQGKAAIIADLFKVVIPVKPKDEKNVILNPNSVRWLMSRRRYHGKVRRALKSRHYVRLADFNAYRDAKFKNVGLSASGYAVAARELGVELPSWITDQPEGESEFSMESTDTGWRLTIENQVPWVPWLPDTATKTGYAVQSKAGKFYDLAVAAWDRAKREF